MKADPDKQHMNGIYVENEADHPSVMALQIDYENVEEPLRSMVHYNGQPSYSEKDDTAQQMHAYKDAVSKFRNHINFVERENHALKRQIANLASRAASSDGQTSHRHQQHYLTSQDNMNQLEDIRSTCVMLAERIKRMEEQNNLLLMNSEKQRCDYERCLDRVSNQVFQTLNCQRRLQMECDSLRNQVRNLTANSPGPMSAGSRSSETSPSGQSNRAGVSDDVFGAYVYGNFTQVPNNGFRSGFQREEASQFPYSPTFPPRHACMPSVPAGNRSPGIAQKSPITDNIFHGQGHPLRYHHQFVAADGMQIHTAEAQYDQRLSPHGTQASKSPPLQMIPETIEPPPSQAAFRPRLPRSGSEIIMASSHFSHAAAVPQRVTLDDGVVGRISRSRDRTRDSSERNKVARSRSFDDHAGYSRTQLARPSHEPMPHRHETNGMQSQPSVTHKSPQSRQQPMQAPFYSSGSVTPQQSPTTSQERVPYGTSASEIRENSRERTSVTLDSCQTESSQATFEYNVVSEQIPESKYVTERGSRPVQFSRGGLQRSFRVTRPCEKTDLTRAMDDVWLPRSGVPNQSPEPLNLPMNRLGNGSGEQEDRNLPPPPPPPPEDDIAIKNRTAENEATVSEKVPSKQEFCTASRRKFPLQDSDSTKDNTSNTSPCHKLAYVEFESHPENKSQNCDIAKDATTYAGEDLPKVPDKTKVPHPKLPLQLQPPKSKPAKKSTKREAPKPPTSKPANVAQEDGGVNREMSPAVSYEAISPTSQNGTKGVPRRLSEGMVRDLNKRSRISAPSQKGRRTKPNASHAQNYDDFSSSQPFPEKTSGKSISGTSTSCNDLFTPDRSPSNDKRSLALSQSNLPSETRNAENSCVGKSRFPTDFVQNEAKLAERSKKSHSRSKQSQPLSIANKTSEIGGITKSEESKVDKKSENKKRNGNQKSFVGLMKSKFGGRGSSNKKAPESQEKQQPSTGATNVAPSSLIDPRTLSLEPNSYPPENDSKKGAKKAVENDFVGRKLSRPFANPVSEISETPHQFRNKSDVSAKRGFLNRHSSKRSKNGRSFENGEHFNKHPYGRVELIPVGSEFVGSYDAKNEDVSPDKHDMPEENPPHDLNEYSLTESKAMNVIETKRQRNDYENVILLSDRKATRDSAEDVSTHNYENVVIIKPENRDYYLGNDSATQSQQANPEQPTKQDKPLEVKQPSPLQRIWSSLSNHSLNKLSGSENGSRTTLHEIGGGRCIPGQVNAEKKGGMYTSEQQMFEKEYISSVVEAELNSKGRRETNSSLKGGERHVENDLVDGDPVTPKSETDHSISSIPEFSPKLAEKSGVSFSTTDSSKSANSGFDSWPSKSTGTDVTNENVRGGSLDARFRDIKSIDELEVGGQRHGLQKKSVVDSRSSLGSFGYGSGVSGSSTTSSNNSRGRSPMRKSLEESNKNQANNEADSSSDNDLTPVPQSNSLQSRYAARRFASPIGGSQISRLAKPANLQKGRGVAGGARMKMGVSSISPPKVRNDDSTNPEKGSSLPKKLPILTCDDYEKQAAARSQIPTKGAELRKPPSELPSRSRFGVQRTSIPSRYGLRQKNTG